MSATKEARWGGQQWNQAATIDTSGASAWEYAIFDGVAYLFVANSNDASGGAVNSVLYKLS